MTSRHRAVAMFVIFKAYKLSYGNLVGILMAYLHIKFYNLSSVLQLLLLRAVILITIVQANHSYSKLHFL
jgi:hypothetical protein